MPGILFACMVADAARLAEMDDWYDREHLPGRMKVPGFRRASRYREASETRMQGSACVYDLDCPEVLNSEHYRTLQAETADDTAMHLRDIELHRLTGVGEATIRRAPAPVLLAAIVPASPRESRRGAIPAATSQGSLRRYASEWQGSPCELVFHDLLHMPNDPAALVHPRAEQWWLFRTVGVRNSGDDLDGGRSERLA